MPTFCVVAGRFRIMFTYLNLGFLGTHFRTSRVNFGDF